ncbi:MAG: hypothetical protein HY854_13830 [Burkholderiales bacterium]|nr:hypothetical protein [Burkholderiales bacterium]
MKRTLPALAPFILALALHGGAASQEASLGRVDFPVTGSAGCQRLFTEGLLALYSFQYDQAHVSFQAALDSDPQCAMAAWGDAMAYQHALWGVRDVAKGRAALARIAAEDRLTDRERGFIATARALYAVEEPQAALRAWLDAAAALHRERPGDDEAALQHALALMAVYEEGTETRELVRAGAIALEVHARKPDHPAAAHYAIHAFDTNDLAVLALPAARRYARIAPGSAHALHMPSHTFVQLGLWPEVVPSNEQAFAESKRAAAKLGQGPDKWDWHALTWLAAAHLELGQARRARQLLAETADVLARHDMGHQRDAYTDMLLGYVMQTGRWDEADALAAPLFVPPSGAAASAGHQHGAPAAANAADRSVGRARIAALRLRAEAAVRRGDLQAAEARVKDVREALERGNPYGSPRALTFIGAHLAEIEARVKVARAGSEEHKREVVAAIERSVELTDSLPVSGPTFLMPARERLAEALLAFGRPAEALAQYELVLRKRPNRALSLAGAALAAQGAGLRAKELAHAAALATQWKDADPDWKGLQQARRQ